MILANLLKDFNHFLTTFAQILFKSEILKNYRQYYGI